MNWSRGLFRLWMVGTALFVVFIAIASYDEIKAQFDAAAVMRVARNDEYIVPVRCGLARGKVGEDFTTKEGQDPGPWDLYANTLPSSTCWYRMTRLRLLYPEYNDLTNETLSLKLYAAAGKPVHKLPDPWVTAAQRVAVALGFPLLVLALGSAIAWALSGFRGSSRSQAGK